MIGLSLVFSVIAIGLLGITILNHLTAEPREVHQGGDAVALFKMKHQLNAGVFQAQNLSSYAELG